MQELLVTACRHMAQRHRSARLLRLTTVVRTYSAVYHQTYIRHVQPATSTESMTIILPQWFGPAAVTGVSCEKFKDQAQHCRPQKLFFQNVELFALVDCSPVYTVLVHIHIQ